MTKAACDSRRIRAVSGSYESRAKYAAAGCGNCQQVENGKGPKAIMTEEAKSIESVPKKEKKCKGPCGRMLPLSKFYTAKNTLDGRESKCKDCKSVRKNENKKKPGPKSCKKGLPARRKEVEYVLPPEPSLADVKLPVTFGEFEVHERARTLISTLEQNSITIDFSNHPAIFENIKNLAEDEFRPVEMQVLYLLDRQLTGRPATQIVDPCSVKLR